MPKQAKLADAIDTLPRAAGNRDVLHFLTRTLQAHSIDEAPHGVIEKLHNLKAALEDQERTLAGWPPSASKDRICAALAKAHKVVAQIMADMATGDRGRPSSFGADRKAI